MEFYLMQAGGDYQLKVDIDQDVLENVRKATIEQRLFDSCHVHWSTESFDVPVDKEVTLTMSDFQNGVDIFGMPC